MINQEIRPRLDSYGTEDMQLPEVRLIQRTGGDWAKERGGKPGQLYNTITDEITDELEVVVVDIMSGRTKWGEDISSQGPECSSNDAKSMRSLNGDDCSTCEYRLDTPWAVDPAERRKYCNLNYTVLAITLADMTPVVIRAHGVSAKPARELIAQLRLNKALRGEYYRAVVNVKSQEKETPFGKVYALHPRIVRLVVDESKVQELKMQSQSLLGAPVLLPEGRPDEDFAEAPESEPVAQSVVEARAEGKGRCKLREFDLMEGCSQCVTEARATSKVAKPQAKAQVIKPDIPEADLWDNL